jgi:hypothetical protein
MIIEHGNRALVMGTYVYVLYDLLYPQQAKYVGITTSPQQRINRHVEDCYYHFPELNSLRNNPDNKQVWVDRMLRCNRKPIMEPLFIVETDKIAKQIETCLQWSFMRNGHQIVNSEMEMSRFGLSQDSTDNQIIAGCSVGKIPVVRTQWTDKWLLSLTRTPINEALLSVCWIKSVNEPTYQHKDRESQT